MLYRFNEWENETVGVDSFQVVYINTDTEKDEGVILQVSAEAEASLLHVASEHGPVENVTIDVLQTKIGIWAGAGAGVALSTNLIDAKVSGFEMTLGFGLNTGAGIHNGSFTINALGSGFSIGKQIKFTIFGNSFGVDFSKCPSKKVRECDQKCRDVATIDTLEEKVPLVRECDQKCRNVATIDTLEEKVPLVRECDQKCRGVATIDTLDEKVPLVRECDQKCRDVATIDILEEKVPLVRECDQKCRDVATIDTLEG